MLYLFKTARRPLYLKENLHLLAAERGSVVEVSYNRMWIAPELLDPAAIAVGTRVCFLFTERPYNQFVPARLGEVAEVQSDEVGLRLRVLLHSWVEPQGMDVAEFTARVQAAAPQTPGAKFLIPKGDDVDLLPYYDDREDAGWKAVIQRIQRMSVHSEDDPYQGSIFFRPLGLEVDGELHQARRVPLPPGTRARLRLRFHNLHLSAEDLHGKRLRVLAAEEALRVEAPDSFPLDGDVDLELEALGPRPELTVQIAPTAARHTSLTQRFVSREEAPSARPALPSPALAGPAPEAEELVRLCDTVFRNATFAAGGEMDVLEGFERLLPDEPRIRERRALALFRFGARGEALPLLQSLDPERLGDEARFALFQLLIEWGAERQPVRHVAALDLASEARFPRLLDALTGMEPRLLGQLVPDLIVDLTPEQVRDIMARVGERIESSSVLAEIATNLALIGDPGWGYEYLDRRRQQLRLETREVVDTLLELAGQGGVSASEADVARMALSRLHNLIEQGQTEEAHQKLRQVRTGLDRHAQADLHQRVASRLQERGYGGEAVDLLLEFAWAACEAGWLEEATAAIQHASSLDAVAGTGRGSQLAEITGHAETAWSRIEALSEWRRSAEERQREQLRAQFLNRCILVAGGRCQQDWVERLEAATGATVEWAERYRDEGDDLGRFAERIKSGRYAVVVHLWQKSGHEVQYRLKDVCKAAGVPFVPAATAGSRGLIEGVWSALSPE